MIFFFLINILVLAGENTELFGQCLKISHSMSGSQLPLSFFFFFLLQV